MEAYDVLVLQSTDSEQGSNLPLVMLMMATVVGFDDIFSLLDGVGLVNAVSETFKLRC
jgi:hypothetical protein